MNGIFTNTNGARIPVTIWAINDKREHFCGGGHPFHVDSVEVVYDFGPSVKRIGGSIVHAHGYRRGDKVMFLGNCADSDFVASLEAA